MKTIAVLALLALANVGDAGSCARVVVRQQAYYPAHQTYQTYQPAYQATYYPPLSIGYQPDSSDLIKELFNAYKQKAEQHEETLKALIATGIQTPQQLKDQLAPPHPGLAIMRQDCASCHSSEDGAKKGGKVVLFEGGNLIATDEQAGDMLLAVEEGRMPKGKKWSDSEKSKFGFYMLRRPPVAAKKP